MPDYLDDLPDLLEEPVEGVTYDILEEGRIHQFLPYPDTASAAINAARRLVAIHGTRVQVVRYVRSGTYHSRAVIWPESADADGTHYGDTVISASFD